MTNKAFYGATTHRRKCCDQQVMSKLLEGWVDRIKFVLAKNLAEWRKIKEPLKRKRVGFSKVVSNKRIEE